jgi:hypothetical protein
MRTEDFWNLIAAGKAKSDGSFDGHAQALYEDLSALPEADILDFDTIFHQMSTRADTWDLWGAAYIIGGGCGDDSFIDFRSWLISMGQAVYEAALANAETLADIEIEDEDDVFFEEFAYIASRAYEDKTGNDMPRLPGPPHEGTSGDEWDEDDLGERFPKLWAKFGES